MRRFVLLASAVFASLVVVGCGGGGGGASGGGGGGGGGTVSFASQVQPIFNNYCVICHVEGGSASFMHLTRAESYGYLVNVASQLTVGGGDRVIPADSANSVLWKRVSGIGLDATEAVMPPGFIIPASDQALIQTWIDEGARNN